MIKKLYCIIISAIIMVSFGITASANSAQNYWMGGQGSSAGIIKEENSPLEVESELLTFDLPEFPKEYYSNTEEFINYSGKVTAKYTIKNPSDKTITSRLAFPFGNMPGYYFSDEFDYGLVPLLYDEEFEITVDGKEIDKTLRHTFSYGFSAFDYKDDSENLYDGFKNDDFYSPNTPVKVYVFEANGIPDEFSDSAYASAPFSLDADKTRVLLAECSGYDYRDYKTAHAGLYVQNRQSFTMYVIGEDIENLPEWTIYEDIAEEKECDGNIELLFTDNSTFKDIALMYQPFESGVSETDWYNAAVDKLNNLNFYTGFLGPDTELMLSDCLMQWYEYEITLEAGETITNSVTVPIYPDINSNFSPTIYDYTYLISPAKSWSSFGKIDVIVKTPYYITDSTLGEFTKIDGGYTLSIDSLPEDELFFTLSTAKNPKEKDIIVDIPKYLVIAALIFSLIVNIVLVIVIIVIAKSKNKNR